MLKFIYVIIVLGLDLYFYHLNIPVQFFWGPNWFTFIFWFLIPLTLSWKGINRSQFSLKLLWTQEKRNLILLLIPLFTIPLSFYFFPSIKTFYLPAIQISKMDTLFFLIRKFLWLLSWLLGWEFIFRYFLVFNRPSNRVFLLIPIMEAAFHYQKPLPEILGSAIFSLFSCWWLWKGRSVLFPFLTHLFIELVFILSLVLAF